MCLSFTQMKVLSMEILERNKQILVLGGGNTILEMSALAVFMVGGIVLMLAELVASPDLGVNLLLPAAPMLMFSVWLLSKTHAYSCTFDRHRQRVTMTYEGFIGGRAGQFAFDELDSLKPECAGGRCIIVMTLTDGRQIPMSTRKMPQAAAENLISVIQDFLADSEA